jgi:hypothetical protein
MGNISSTNQNNNKFKEFYDIVDYIATYYILTMDFKSLSKLSEKEYCDKLVVLTTDIIDRYFNEMQVQYLAQRIKEGMEVNTMSSENVRFINKDNLEDYDISKDVQKTIKKKRVCIGIAKFYVKIAHIFSAIVMTINPVFTYKDPTGEVVKVPLLEKDKIPRGVERKVFKLNICDNRIRALKQGEFVDEASGDVSIQPKVCDMNTTKDGKQKTLEDEPGIPELMRLYLDDNYDYSNGSFKGMSPETERQFRRDLKLFYTVFTGNTEMPDTIQKFSDIKLRDYSKREGCLPPESYFKSKYTMSKKDELFVNYANNIKSMIQNASRNQSKLLEVINELFTHVLDPYSGKRVVRVNPKLTDESLQRVVEKTRKYIINLYVKCETDYVEGVKLFEAIVESKIFETTKSRISNLGKEVAKIAEDTKPDLEPKNIQIKPLPMPLPASSPELVKPVNQPFTRPEQPQPQALAPPLAESSEKQAVNILPAQAAPLPLPKPAEISQSVAPVPPQPGPIAKPVEPVQSTSPVQPLPQLQPQPQPTTKPIETSQPAAPVPPQPQPQPQPAETNQPIQPPQQLPGIEKMNQPEQKQGGKKRSRKSYKR